MVGELFEGHGNTIKKREGERICHYTIAAEAPYAAGA